MKILILGASQGTGALCVKSSRARGDAVSAFSRTPSKLDITDSGVTKIAGDFHDSASVRSAVAGQDAVIICAAPKPSAIKDKPDYFSSGTKNCIDSRAKGKYVRTAELISVPSSTSRADLADFMVEACESTAWVGKAVQLGG